MDKKDGKFKENQKHNLVCKSSWESKQYKWNFPFLSRIRSKHISYQYKPSLSLRQSGNIKNLSFGYTVKPQLILDVVKSVHNSNQVQIQPGIVFETCFYLYDSSFALKSILTVYIY